MDTPIVKLSDKELESVYEPSEDTYLLIDALEADLETLRTKKPTIFLEIGSGSGVIIAALAMAFKNYGHFVAIDINAVACGATKNTSSLNSVDVDVIRTDLLSCIRKNFVFDIVVFNPPYVITESEEILDNRLDRKTWAGGRNGREVMEKVFPSIPKILSASGVFYLVVIKENDPEYILQKFRQLDMLGKIACERKIRGEHLYVLRFVKNT